MGVHRTRVHDLRHTSATLLFRAGWISTRSGRCSGIPGSLPRRTSTSTSWKTSGAGRRRAWTPSLAGWPYQLGRMPRNVTMARVTPRCPGADRFQLQYKLQYWRSEKPRAPRRVIDCGALTCLNQRALGGTRTPNLLIRSQIWIFRWRPWTSTPSADLVCSVRWRPPASTLVRRLGCHFGCQPCHVLDHGTGGRC